MHFSDLPRGIPGTGADQGQAPRALWLSPRVVQEHAFWSYETGKVFLGVSGQQVIGVSDNRHLLTIAGSRSGKGTSAIVPNLLLYPGSVLVIDPKGENASLTAERRGKGNGIPEGGLHQDVYVIDPFGVAKVDDAYRAGFNPLAGLDPRNDVFIDECDAIADALVVQEGKGDNAHFYDSARLVLRGYIAWVATHADVQDKTLNEVRRLIFLPRLDSDEIPEGAAIEVPDVNNPQLSFNALNVMMRMDERFAHGIPFEAASTLASMGEREFGSVMSTIRNQIGFISSPPMSRVLAGQGRTPDITSWKHGSQSVYLCLPAGRLHRHFRFFRLFINRLMNAIEADERQPQTPALLILDEMHVLGHMKALETAAGLIAGFGVRIWSFFQDLSQLKRIYGEGWETFLGNSGIFQTFGLNDFGSLKYVSERLGVSSTLSITQQEQNVSAAAQGFSGKSQSIQQSPLLSPEEIAYFFSRQSENQLIIYPGSDPIMIHRLPYTSKFFQGFRSI
ncbi:type IV secretory system conjugative DNA transfer family protein [Dinoroseobacter sp. S76]|uniref:type IV secretory system conjugative DNA transfer family protein n=1 Tax=Dinoroseobacter sp. S76 TaxID=3415124 RepID=UPI003C7E5916